MPLLQRTQFLEKFQCLGDKCEDTCCKGWGMQIDAAMTEKYRQQAPELLDAVTSGEAEHIMRRDPATDYCIKFEGGWCGIHRKYGDAFLGDACHFFPRITRKIGEKVHQTASLSCPEIVRNILYTEQPFLTVTRESPRIPQEIKQYAETGMDETALLTTHHAFLAAAEDTSVNAERIICRIVAVADSLEKIDKASWPAASGFYLTHADGRLPPAELSPTDPFLLFHALIGLVNASQKTSRPRLEKLISNISQALNVAIPEDASQPLLLAAEHLTQVAEVQQRWQEQENTWQPHLKRWLQAQLSMSFFPFSGFGDSLPHKAAIIGIRLATLKLALMAELQVEGKLNDEILVRNMQSLSRFLDHLADPTFSLNIYQETGWLKLARLRGLLRDC